MIPMNFIEHPEGGRYSEVFRSGVQIKTGSGKDRSALTHIYFSLNGDEVSHFHRLLGDEVWNLYRGQGLYLYLWDEKAPAAQRVELSESSNEFCHIVPAGVWQAAVPIQDTVLVGCSVAPGFEFADFELMTPPSQTAERLVSSNPELSPMILGASPDTHP